MGHLSHVETSIFIVGTICSALNVKYMQVCEGRDSDCCFASTCFCVRINSRFLPTKHRQLRCLAIPSGEAQPRERYFWDCTASVQTNEPLKNRIARTSSDPSVRLSPTSTCIKIILARRKDNKNHWEAQCLDLQQTSRQCPLLTFANTCVQIDCMYSLKSIVLADNTEM